jgi:hypothetical protein
VEKGVAFHIVIYVGNRDRFGGRVESESEGEEVVMGTRGIAEKVGYVSADRC